MFASAFSAVVVSLRNILSQSPKLKTSRRRQSQSTTAQLVELLESRKLLSAAPVVSGFTGTETYQQGSAGLNIAAAIVLTDADSTDLTGATVSFTNWQAGDRLTFDNTFNLQHNFIEDLNAHTATLEITGTGSLAAYETTLRSLEFRSVAGVPDTTTRVATITVTDGTDVSNVASENIALQTSAQPPRVSDFETAPLVFAANHPEAPSVAISSTLKVADSDSNQLTGATVQISSGYQNDSNGSDLLSFTSSFGITGSFDASTGTLTLSGNAYVGNYREALKRVTFSTSGTAVSTNPRTLSIVAYDDTVTPLASVVVMRDVNVTTTNVAPTITGFSGAQTYPQGSAGLSIAPNVVVADSDSSGLFGAKVTFSNWQIGDRITFENTYNLQHSFSQDFETHTATLTLSGLGTPAAYQSTLRTIQYRNVAGVPEAATLSVGIVVNDGVSDSNAATGSIEIQTSDQAPVLSGIETTPLKFASNHPETPSVAITSTLSIADPDSDRLTGATIQITSGYQNNDNGQDTLSFVNQNGITGTFDALTGTLTLTGSSYVGNYREAIRSVMFGTSGADVSTNSRTLTITTFDDSETPLASNVATREITVTTKDTLIAPAGSADTPGGFNADLPFTFPLTTGLHAQVLYDASLFSNVSGPQYITELRFRPVDPAGEIFGDTLSVSNVTLKMSTTSKSEESNPLNMVFDSNLGTDTQVVYTGELSMSTAGIGANATGPFDYVVKFQTPFLYDPSAGSLLLDVVVNPGTTVQGNSPYGTFPRFDMTSDTVDGVSSVINPNLAVYPTMGLVASSAPVTEFVFTPAPKNVQAQV